MTHVTLPADRMSKNLVLDDNVCDYHRWDDDSIPTKNKLVLENDNVKRMCAGCRPYYRSRFVYPTDEQLGVYMLRNL